MAARRTRGSRWCRTVLTVTAASLVLGCTYEDREPGLFGRDAASTGPPSSAPPPSPPQLANPELPVAGESVWTSADGLDIQVRFAVHAVRRVDGATVLDWSVTPVRGFNLRPGDAVPASFDLGLSRQREAIANVYLVDAGSRAVYRPLGRATDADYCLCTPLWLAQRSLRVGVTSILQTAYPELPGALRTVDVSIASVPQFWRVPVTPVGHVPVATGPTDLTRSADAEARVDASEMFRFGPSRQVFRVRVQRVVASSTFTSVEWAIVSVTGGEGIETASIPPFAGADADTVTGFNPVAASGPSLAVDADRTVLRPRVITNGLTSAEAGECLCTDLRSWAGVLRRPDKVATVVTNYPALPTGTRRVEVVFDGLAPMEVAVTPAVDASKRIADPVPTDLTFWRFRRDSPRPGWEPGDWPTPVPGRPQLERYPATVEELVR